MNTPQIISNYESLCALTSQMRNAAERCEWDQLIDLEKQCSQLVERMKSSDEGEELDEAIRQQVVQLIRKSIANDTEIRNQTKIQIAQLQKTMHSNQLAQHLSKAYGAF